MNITRKAQVLVSPVLWIESDKGLLDKSDTNLISSSFSLTESAVTQQESVHRLI